MAKETEQARSAADQIKQLMKLEDAGSHATLDNIEKIKKNHSDPISEKVSEALVDQIKHGLKEKLDKMGHIHTAELIEVQRKLGDETVKQDSEIDKAKL
jgi:hypothetical protein